MAIYTFLFHFVNNLFLSPIGTRMDTVNLKFSKTSKIVGNLQVAVDYLYSGCSGNYVLACVGPLL